MIALFLLLGLLLYLGLAFLITYFIRQKFAMSRAKLIATSVSLMFFFSIPIVDELVGKWHFNHMCEKEAKITIHKSVNGVEGILGSGLGSQAFDEFRYRFLEEEVGGRYYRYSRGAQGERIKVEINRPVSRYVVRRSIEDQPYNIRKYEEVIFDRQTEEALAKSILFSYGGGWVSQLVRSLGVSGGGRQCHDPQTNWKDFYLKTLNPVRPAN